MSSTQPSIAPVAYQPTAPAGRSPLGPRHGVVHLRNRDVRRPDLSAREIEVLLAWLRAESKEQAASELFISASTIATHVARIRVKYAAVGRPAPSKSALFARAIQDGYTTLADW
ncbi:LuxR C-terminal-related transcriptional regulator [Gordonia bronchialis]|uniref:LuxR C-terminal-related transcriptional regulator n=1 Tax=Gordonia bronchialis TaxID=2054 RepID=UPI00242F50FD|nr:LuxR C-terminal-related transcriptional regulator [Gordonia bronchialis]